MRTVAPVWTELAMGVRFAAMLLARRCSRYVPGAEFSMPSGFSVGMCSVQKTAYFAKVRRQFLR